MDLNMQQKHIFTLAAVLFLFTVSVPVTYGKTDDSSHAVKPSFKDQDNIGLGHFLGQESARYAPSIAVEIDEENNEASLKIIHLPVVRKQKSALSNSLLKEQDIEKTKLLSRAFAYKENSSNLPKVRHARDIDFKIYDQTVIQAMIEALRKIDPVRADLLQSNIFRVKVKVEIDDDDDDDWFYRIKYALGLV